MKIRFGYVANALGLWDASPSKTLTFTRYKKLPKSERLNKLKEVTAQNLQHTKRILHYNIAHEIELYRLSSSLVPLATHPEVRWDYITPFLNDWREIGELIKKFHLRVSFHPNQFTLFTSDKKSVTANSIINMQYHFDMLEAMDVVEDSLINIHIGGAYGDKEQAIIRFHHQLKDLSPEIKQIMTLENDDKTYNVEETLRTCEKEKMPMILDYHHHVANQMEEELEFYLPRIYDTWKNFTSIPKIHISSPKSEKDFRSHADCVSLDFILPFLRLAKEFNQDFDIMVEAKMKNLAMHRLIEEIAAIRGLKRTSGASIEW